MAYLKCIQDCFMGSGVQCFSNGSHYQLISGSPQDIAGVELLDDQGSLHFVSGEWVDRFLIMAPSMEMNELLDDMKSRHKEREECRLWEEDKPSTRWALNASKIWEIDSNPTPPTEW